MKQFWQFILFGWILVICMIAILQLTSAFHNCREAKTQETEVDVVNSIYKAIQQDSIAKNKSEKK
jgi:hypothetical protein